MENLDGFIGSIGVAVLKKGLKPETEVSFIVSMQLFEGFGRELTLRRDLRILVTLQLAFLQCVLPGCNWPRYQQLNI